MARTTYELVRETDQATVLVHIEQADIYTVLAFEDRWRPALREQRAQDAEWPWRAELAESSDGIVRETGQRWEILELAGEDDVLHGLFSLKHPVRSQLEPDANVLYVERVSAAPWNRPAARPNRLALGCGIAMMRYAVERSIELGTAGRVGLHSLPDPNTYAFYETQVRMRLVGEDDLGEEGKLRYYELDEEGARGFLERTDDERKELREDRR